MADAESPFSNVPDPAAGARPGPVTYEQRVAGEGQDRIRAAYCDAKYELLSRLKTEWDPTNHFRGNQNIEPAH